MLVEQIELDDERQVKLAVISLHDRRHETEEPFPYAGVRPASEPGVNCAPLAEYFWQITPAVHVACHPPDRIPEQSLVHAVVSVHPGPLSRWADRV
ncbi:hypothetical protein NS226_09335 [Aureimonas ureilytica]|uniref:Uncharacterized protein n=1 Tax=Aureimonas ureilytica TaxID=401562 RepID=A0A175R8J4_9HYPH|nr:hypothetical protein NS226_09335 [Aureimonas ureilytica]